MTGAPITSEITEQLTCCADALDALDQRVQLALFRLPAEGAPVETARLATEVGLERSDVSERLGRWHGLHTDDDGRIAFQGLSVVEAPHSLRVDGRGLFTSCAWDTLFLPELIGRPAGIESTCPVTGVAITLRVEPEGPEEVSPAGAVLSFVLPGARFGDDTIACFCNFTNYFASPEAAEEWTARPPPA